MTFENLVTATDGEYQLEHMGSQMADLLADIDACSTRFIENYKEAVVQAALEQRARLGLGPATQRDLAATTNISLDSVRRGLEALVTEGIVTETTNGRSQTYTLATPPMTAAPALDLDLKDIDEPRTLDPDLKAALDNIDNPVPLGSVLQDNGPDVEPPAAVVTQGTMQQCQHPAEDKAPEPPLDEEGYNFEDDGDFAGDDADFGDDDYEDDDYEESPYDWNDVPVSVRDTLYIQAEAAGMGLSEYLLLLTEVNERRIQRAITGQEDNVIRTLMNEVLNLQRQNANLRVRSANRPTEG